MAARASKKRDRRKPFTHGLLRSSSQIHLPTKAELEKKAADDARHEARVHEVEADEELRYTKVQEARDYAAYIRECRRKGRKPRLARKPIREAIWNMCLVI